MYDTYITIKISVGADILSFYLNLSNTLISWDANEYLVNFKDCLIINRLCYKNTLNHISGFPSYDKCIKHYAL